MSSARPPASIAGSYAASAWTGEVMVVVAPGTGAATYDPEEDTWQEIAAPVVSGRVARSGLDRRGGHRVGLGVRAQGSIPPRIGPSWTPVVAW